MAFQFIHIETYARSSKNGTSARSIIGEATREDGYCPHVAKPQQPVVLSGPHPGEWYAGVEERASQAKDKMGRKIRKDAHLIVAGVASYPVRCDELDDAEREKLMAWADETVTWFEKKHGKGCAVMHLDEEFPHVHMYAEADLAAGQRAGDLHPGEAAKKNAPNKKLAKKKAYTDAMRQYQDDYFQDIASRYGMARTGPERRRMTRAEWQAEQATLKQMAERQQKAEKAVSVASERASKVISDAEAKAEGIREKITRSVEKQNRQHQVIKERSAKLAASEKAVKDQEKAISDKQAELTLREQSVADSERRLAGFWPKLVSVVTLGRKGVEKRVRDAQDEIRQSTETEIKKLKGSLNKARKERDKQTEKLSVSEATMKRRLNAESNKVSDLKLELESLTRQLDQERQRNKPLEADNATLARDLRVMKARVSELQTAFDAGDIDSLKKGLSKLTATEQPEKTQTQPSRPRINWDDEHDSDLPGLL